MLPRCSYSLKISRTRAYWSQRVVSIVEFDERQVRTRDCFAVFLADWFIWIVSEVSCVTDDIICYAASCDHSTGRQCSCARRMTSWNCFVVYTADLFVGVVAEISRSPKTFSASSDRGTAWQKFWILQSRNSSLYSCLCRRPLRTSCYSRTCRCHSIGDYNQLHHLNSVRPACVWQFKWSSSKEFGDLNITR